MRQMILGALVLACSACLWAEDPAAPAAPADAAAPAAPADAAAPAAPAGTPVAITFVDLSPSYPWAEGEPDKAYAPEIQAEEATVAWNLNKALNNEAFIDLFAAQTEAKQPALNSAIYARVILEAEADGKLALSMGSDDGLAVFVNGTNAFRNNVMRGLTADQDKAEVALVKGKNTLLFRVTQGLGGWSLQVKATALGGLVAKQVAAEAAAVAVPANAPAEAPKADAPAAQ